MTIVSFVYDSLSEQDTDRIGRLLGECVQPGLVVALNGQLGSGKTRLVRAISAGLGVEDEMVNSPTFVLMQVYNSGRLPIYHFDTYRIGDIDEFLAIGAEDYLLGGTGVSLIEWAEIVQPVLPPDLLSVTIVQTGKNSRRIDLSADGPVSTCVITQLQEALEAAG